MIVPQADSPVTGFRPFFNPATGEWITYTAIAADSGGQLVRFSWRSVPGGVITEHVHPHQEERFTILAGEAHFTLNGAEHVAGAGETVVVPAGVPHSEGNPGPAEIEGVVELRTSCSRRCGHWPGPSVCTPITTAGTAGSAVVAAARRPGLISGLVLTGPFVRNAKTSVMQRLLLRVAMAPPWAAISWKSYLPKLYAGRRPADFGEYRDQVVASLRRPGHAKVFSATTRLADWIGHALHGQVVMVPEAGHYPQSQRPDITTAAVVRFLESVQGRT